MEDKEEIKQSTTFSIHETPTTTIPIHTTEDAPTIPPSRTLTHRIKESAFSFAPLSIIAFGGPPAHIALLHNTFVVRKKWLDDTLFSEFFAVSQALPGPGSTEMLFSIAIHRGGILGGIVGFFCWSLPGLVIMSGLGLGVSNLPNPLPLWLTHLQNGISAAAVGLVAQAAVALAAKNVPDKPTLVVCTLAACAEILYSASWLEPVIIAAGGLATWGMTLVLEKWERRTKRDVEKGGEGEVVDVDGREETVRDRGNEPSGSNEELLPTKPATPHAKLPFGWRTGLLITFLIIILLLLFIILKPQLTTHRPIALLTQFYIAGCIIFGGGPVVIPLLYSYVVVPGWLSESDFLLGVALIQAMPGPNFNFAAYCGAVALSTYKGYFNVGYGILGALLGYIGIFFPGLALNAASLPLWTKIRSSKVIQRCLPGMNAAAVGLVFSAAYLLWTRGIVRGGGVVETVGTYPWYAVVTGVAFVLVNVKVRSWVVMILGLLAGLVGWGVGVY